MINHKTMRAIRAQLGLSQSQMGNVLGVTKVQIARMEALPHIAMHRPVMPLTARLVVLLMTYCKNYGALPDFDALEASALEEIASLDSKD